MLTSESNNREFQHFFKNHQVELAERLAGLLMKKHRRTILSLLKQDAKIPPIWGILKLPEATLYMLPIGLKPAKVNFQVTSLSSFLVMKDLKEQTPIMVTDSQPHVIMYSAHAVRRYKERMELDPETEYLDVCKQMFLNGCSNPRMLADMNKIYGSNVNRRQLSLISLDGAYLGFADGNTEVLHAETFLSPNELRDDQQYLDASKSEDLAHWKALREAFARGEITNKDLIDQAECRYNDFEINNGRIVELTPEEAKLRTAEYKEALNNPEYLEKSIEENKEKYNNKVKRKGYK